MQPTVNPNEPCFALSRVLFRAVFLGTAMYVIGEKKHFVRNAVILSAAAEMFGLLWPVTCEKIHGETPNA